MELEVCIQHYDWGKLGLESQVAKLYKSSNPDANIKNIPYAELWMGTHVNGPSKVKSTGDLLLNVLEKNPEYLGQSSLKKFGNDLPFLFKVLSVNRSLSIQAHPTKQHAEILHVQKPDLYKDPNHKPELAIALTNFKAMCGFRPQNEIKLFMQNVPELRAIVGEENAQKLIQDSGENPDLLKTCFTTLMKASKENIQKNLKSLLERTQKSTTCGAKKSNDIENLIIKLHDQYPDDVGCFGPYFFNVLDLNPGQALYLAPNEPHAYLYGDCIECMACSDNVVRGGLTPKFIDTDTLCDMLNYKGVPSNEIVFNPIQENDFTQFFKPPVPDFAVVMIKLDKPGPIIKREVASILLCVEGEGKTDTLDVNAGKVFFIPANEQFQFVSVKKILLLFQGLANV